MEKLGSFSSFAAESQIFNISGPSYMTTIDWQDPNHRRSIAASLVQGVYIQEHDRQQQRQGPIAFATPWWDFFHFQLNRALVDDSDLSIFGAIYEFKYTAYHCNDIGLKPPQYVIAFRGALTKPETRSQDLMLDLRCVCNKLPQSHRFQVAIQAVQDMVSLAGAPNVWLAGHSLGSAIVLQVGRNMVKTGYHLETYAFNPPYISAPIEQIKNQKLRHGVRIASSVLKAGLAVAVKAKQAKPEQDDSFTTLSAWIPYLFVNPSDPICSEYIGYFKHRQKMVSFGAGQIERLATQNSYGSLLSGALGKDSEPSHLIPTAYLTTNLIPTQGFKQSHGVEQWWVLNLNCEAKLHQFK